MEGLPAIPHGTPLEVWFGFLFSFIVGSAGWIKVWLNRKRPSTIAADNTKILAEARKLDVDASTALGEVIVAMSSRALEAQSEIDEQRSRHIRETQYLKDQLDHRQQQEEDARTRAHNAIDEVNRAVRCIKQHEAIFIREQIPFEPFAVKTYKEIMGDD
jgi:hypothetical protein